MAKGKAISDDLRGVVIRMVAELRVPLAKVCEYTGVPRRSVERILTTYKRTGQSARDHTIAPSGRPRLLQYNDIGVSVIHNKNSFLVIQYLVLSSYKAVLLNGATSTSMS